MTLLHETSGLRDVEQVRKQHGCPGCEQGHSLEVSVFFLNISRYLACYGCLGLYFNLFKGIEKLVLCTCTEPLLQLLLRGLFPCAPSEPSLAVDLNVLDFACELFVNAAPNTTTWCETLEGFLSACNFKLKTQVCFSFHWVLSSH